MQTSAFGRWEDHHVPMQLLCLRGQLNHMDPDPGNCLIGKELNADFGAFSDTGKNEEKARFT